MRGQGTMRLTPSENGIRWSAEYMTVGMPARSSSLTIVAPQRLQVPQVAVKMTARIPSRLSSSASSRPNFCARSSGAALPVVTYIQS